MKGSSSWCAVDYIALAILPLHKTTITIKTLSNNYQEIHKITLPDSPTANNKPYIHFTIDADSYSLQ